jgi:anti-sigma factor RsiW
MGAAAGSAARNGGTALIISSNGTSTAYYTWAQAQQEGAGVAEEPPVVTVPPESPAGEEPTPPPPPPAASPPPGSSGTPPSSTSAPPSSEALAASSAPTAQIAALLGDHLLPSGRAARIPAILKRGGITLTLPPGLHGRLVVDYYLGSTRRLLVAKGSRRLAGSTEAIAVTLTASGRHLLEHRGRAALAVYAMLLPAGSPAIDVSKPVVLTR